MNARLHLVLAFTLYLMSCIHGVCSNVDNIRDVEDKLSYYGVPKVYISLVMSKY
jgi:hypothetical protein